MWLLAQIGSYQDRSEAEEGGAGTERGGDTGGETPAAGGAEETVQSVGRRALPGRTSRTGFGITRHHSTNHKV